MMQAYIFPGQGAQFEGMGQAMFERSGIAREYFRTADEIMGFPLSKLMMEGSADDLKVTKVAQPAIFVHSLLAMTIKGEADAPDVVAGHSLGEMTALVAAQVLDFEQGLRLVAGRAVAMQKACESTAGSMVAVIGFDDSETERICAEIEDVVVPANYNTDGQLVISGTERGVNRAMEALREAGARMLVKLPVSGGFHSPLMEAAKIEFGRVVNKFDFKTPICPIYQNVTGLAEKDPGVIKSNIIRQITEPVYWKQSMENMLSDGVTDFVEVGGKGNVLKGFIKKIDRKIPIECIN